jgi:hypothetical protein
VLAHYAVYSLHPAAAVPGEAVGFGCADVLFGLPGGYEQVVEVDGGMPAGKEDLDGYRGSESDLQG